MAMVYNPATGRWEDNGLPETTVAGAAAAPLHQALNASQGGLLRDQGLSLIGNNLNNMAATAQAVGTAPQGLLGALNQPGQALPNDPAVGSDLRTVVTGGLQGVGNAIGAGVVAPLDVARSLAVRALGGDPNNLQGGQLTDQAFALSEQGFNDAGAAAGRIGDAASRIGRGLQAGALGLLGAQPAAAQPARAPVAAPAPAAPTVQPVAAPAPAPALPPMPPSPPLRTEEDLAPVNAAIAGQLAAARPAPQSGGIMQPAQRGNYNMYNTQVASSRGPASNGIDFGFGPGGAKAYLGEMRQRDMQAELMQNARMDRLNQASLVAHFNDPFASIEDKKFLMAQMGLAAQQSGQSAQLAQQNNLGVLGAQNQRDAAALQAGTQRDIAAQRAAAALGAAQITGQYGLQGAQLKSSAAVQAAQARIQAAAGTNALAEQNARIAQIRANALQAGITNGEFGTAAAVNTAARSGQEPRGPITTDPNTGYLIPAEAQDLGGQAQVLQAQANLEALKKRLGIQ